MSPSAIGPKSFSPLDTIRSSNARMTRYSSESALSGAGTKPARSNSSPLCTSSVASPPSSRIIVGPAWPGQRSICSVHHQYSSSGLALPREDRHALGIVDRAVRSDDDRRGGVVLGREDVAADPPNVGAEGDQRLDQHRGLDRHVQRSGDARSAQGLGARRTRRASP